jgi:hypothetical protein
MKLPEPPGSGGGTVALYERCGEEISVANDLDLAGDVDQRRHLVMTAGSRRSLTATHWQIFMLLYRRRGDVVYNDPSTPNSPRAGIAQRGANPGAHAAAPQGARRVEIPDRQLSKPRL